MRILHLSDSTLSGSPIRISNLLNKYSPHESRHLVWLSKIGFREFETDLVGPAISAEEARYWIHEWADFIHYHNRWKRQLIFSTYNIEVPKKPSVIQIHSPRNWDEDFSAEAKSGIPIAIIAQYHVREWPEAKYIIPNVVDIYDPSHMPVAREGINRLPVVSFAPSNCNLPGWNYKGYDVVAPVLKRLRADGIVNFQLIVQKPHDITLALKQSADIGIDEVVTGSYHLSSLEYLSMGVPCFSHLDEKTSKVVKDLTGATTLPWIDANKDSFRRILLNIVHKKSWGELGVQSRNWVEKYWNPDFLASCYDTMYTKISSC
jgi:hypothetical protein